MPHINLVAAVEQGGGIGKDGGLPWNLSKDWDHFLKLATRSQSNLLLVLLDESCVLSATDRCSAANCAAGSARPPAKCTI